MSQELHGKIEIKDPGHLQNTVISLDGHNGDVFIGGPPGGFGHRGRLVIGDKDGNETFSVDGQTGELSQSGDLRLKDADLIITNADEVQVLRLSKRGDVDAGGGNADGELILRDKDGNAIVYIGADARNLIIQNSNGDKIVELGREGDLYLGGGNKAGDLVVRDGQGRVRIRLDGQDANLHIGANDQAGDVLVNNATGQDTIHLEGESGNIELNGEIKIKDWTLSVPDYVFAADYKLLDLGDLKNYITANHHLPEIPSAVQVAKKGVEIGHFSMLLLKKIEELSLYIIQQQQLIEEQGKRLLNLEQKNSDR